MPTTHNNSVTVLAGLTCTVLSSPAIGSAGVGYAMAYTEGDAASDNYISISATGSPGTALHADLGANGVVFVSNPTSGQTVTLYVGTTVLGPLLAGMAAVVPVSSGAILKGSVASGTQQVGVTAIKCAANA